MTEVTQHAHMYQKLGDRCGTDPSLVPSGEAWLWFSRTRRQKVSTVFSHPISGTLVKAALGN